MAKWLGEYLSWRRWRTTQVRIYAYFLLTHNIQPKEKGPFSLVAYTTTLFFFASHSSLLIVCVFRRYIQSHKFDALSSSKKIDIIKCILIFVPSVRTAEELLRTALFSKAAECRLRQYRVHHCLITLENTEHHHHYRGHPPPPQMCATLYARSATHFVRRP